MSFSTFWLIWILFSLIFLVARSFYQRHREERRMIMEDRRYLNRFVTRPLFLLGEWDSRRRRRWNGDEDNISISRLRLSDYFVSAPKQKEIASPPGARLVIHNSGLANRCEVCHHSDCFNPTTGHCTRCNHRTV
jgi:hypothetical protein